MYVLEQCKRQKSSKDRVLDLYKTLLLISVLHNAAGYTPLCL